MTIWTGESIVIFTDGACTGNPGPGGWGALILTPDQKVMELGGGDQQTTNNRMEILAAIKALKSLSDPVAPIWLYTDSTYLIRGITQWIFGWRRRGWVSAEGAPVANQDLWEALSQIAQKFKGRIDWRYVRGHQGVPGNERADEIAVGFAQGRHTPLFKGSLLQYDVAITDLPEPQPLPEIKAQQEKKKAFSYLSLVNGELQKHATWLECEARVKGRPGAKFKKAMSQDDEIKIAKEWGYSPNKTPK